MSDLAAKGFKEVVLLGQNVNSYHDSSEEAVGTFPEGSYSAASGFRNLYRSRDGPGARFVDLLEAVSAAVPEVRIRFTSPHPKVRTITYYHTVHANNPFRCY